jgi:hypothetical protein
MEEVGDGTAEWFVTGDQNMANFFKPQQKYLAVTSAGQTMTFLPVNTYMGAGFVVNSGSKYCWFTFDGIAVASNGDGRTILPPGGVLNLGTTYYKKIHFITAGLDTTDIQVIATQAPS